MHFFSQKRVDSGCIYRPAMPFVLACIPTYVRSQVAWATCGAFGQAFLERLTKRIPVCDGRAPVRILELVLSDDSKPLPRTLP